MRRSTVLLAALSLSAQAMAAPPLAPSPPVLDGYGNVPRSALNYAAKRYAPVCSGGLWPGESGANGAGQQTSFRRLLYCPRGATSIRLLLTNNYTPSGGPEADGTSALPINLGIEPNVPAPWISTKSYASGQSVTFGRANWTAASANVGSAPSATNPNWVAAPNLTPIGVTCNGTHTCVVPLIATGAGAAISEALVWSDAIPVNVAAGGFIAIDGWTNQFANGGAHQLGHTVNIFSGEFWANFATQTDRSLTGGYPAVASVGGIAALWGPVAVDGVPLVSGPTVCYLSDSIGAGVVGNGVTGTGGFSGGAGYVASDVGAILTLGSSGASAGGVNAAATFQIGAVSAGAITTIWLATNGSYASTLSQPSQTLPSGAQTLTGPTTGSGASVSSLSFGNPHDPGGPYNGSGPIQRGLDAAGIPWVGFARSADQLAFWVGAGGRDYSRLAAIQAAGCSSVIVEPSVNDLGLGASAATVEAYAAALSAQLYGIGVKGVYYTTATPEQTTSTDGFLTLANQTPNAFLSARNVYNAWIRTTPAGIMNGYIDIAAAVESSSGSGKFAVNGSTPCWLTCDGIHPSLTGEPFWATPVAAFAVSGALQ